MKKTFLNLITALGLTGGKRLGRSAFLAVSAITLMSCNSSVKPGDSTLNANVPYKVAKNYFVKNTVAAAYGNTKIESQADFDKVFGSAASMGQNGKPTPIDFSKEFVVAQVEDTSSQLVDLKPISVKKNANILEVTYKKSVGENRTFTSRSALLLIIDKKYDGDVNFVEVQ